MDQRRKTRWLIMIPLFFLILLGGCTQPLTSPASPGPRSYIRPGPESVTNIRIESVPPGAGIYINGTWMGITNETIMLKPGVYALELTNKGYQKYSETIIVNLSTLHPVQVILIPEPSVSTPTALAITAPGPGPRNIIPAGPESYSSIRIESVPSGAGIYINGTWSGLTNETIHLNQGSYTLELTNKGYQKYSENIVVNLSTPPPLQVILIPEPSVSTTTVSPKGAAPGPHSGPRLTLPTPLALPAVSVVFAVLIAILLGYQRRFPKNEGIIKSENKGKK